MRLSYASVIAALILTLAGAHASPPRLSQDERSALRYRLESLFNEVDLLVRNQRSDSSDRARLEREMGQLQIYERIPRENDLEGLKRELARHAAPHGIEIRKVELLGADQPTRSIPKELFTNTPRFRLEPRQFVQTLRLRLTLSGEGPKIYEWIQKWPDEQLRLVEPEKSYERPGIREVRPARFTVLARSFRFREVRFPRLKPRDPLSLLPTWARTRPESFAQEEPMLWDLVPQIRERLPQTPILYDLRGAFLLDSARLSFFLKKAKEASKPVAVGG